MQQLPQAVMLSVFLWSLIYYLNSGIDAVTSATLFLVCTLFTLFLLISYNKLYEFYFARKDENELLDSLRQIIYYGSNGASMLSLLNLISEITTANKIKLGLIRVRARMRLGGDFFSAIHEVFSKELSILKLNFLNSTNSTLEEISTALHLHDQSQNETAATSLDSLQRGSTISMFLSTLLPSFALFTFVGGSILSQGTPNFILLSMILLIFVPFLYALNMRSFARRLIGETIQLS
ncbi:MAG: hypothetical protein KGH71_02880 [Candidatus Micrarchaeota archaeon]|nr:hypothetical protein [Candidatus Micrarchaeota archaeon]